MEQYQKRAEAQYNADVDAHELRLAKEAVTNIRSLAMQFQRMMEAGRDPHALACLAHEWHNPDDDIQEMFKLVRESEGRGE